MPEHSEGLSLRERISNATLRLPLIGGLMLGGGASVLTIEQFGEVPVYQTGLTAAVAVAGLAAAIGNLRN